MMMSDNLVICPECGELVIIRQDQVIHHCGHCDHSWPDSLEEVARKINSSEFPLDNFSIQ